MSEELKYNEPWILQRADPYVYRHTDGNYYFTASIPAYDRIVLRRSETLAGLKDAEEVTVWEKHKEGIMSEHIWAPELHFNDNLCMVQIVRVCDIHVLAVTVELFAVMCYSENIGIFFCKP